MMRFIRDLRLIPIALIASACLLALKTADLVFDGGYLLRGATAPAPDGDATVVRTAPGVPRPSDPHRSWAQQMFNFPGAGGKATASDVDIVPGRAAPPATSSLPSLADANAGDITGSLSDTCKAGSKDNAHGCAHGAGGAKVAGDAKNANPSAQSNGGGIVIRTDGAALPSGAERAILERLQQRRQELDRRSRELDIREGLIQAAEKRIDGKLAELKQVQGQIAAATQTRKQAEAARFKSLVTMYENMKARDAAKIFDHLELGVLIEVASRIDPRHMADILAQMNADSAERLTVELASRASLVDKGAAGLPKIDGRPTSQ